LLKVVGIYGCDQKFCRKGVWSKYRRRSDRANKGNAMGEKTSKKNVKKPSKSIKEKRAEKRGAAAAADSIVIPKK